MHDDSRTTPSRPHGATQTPDNKRRLGYILGGCGCLAVGFGLLALVGLFALSSLAQKSKDSDKKAGTTISKPSKERKARAQEAVETYLDHLEKGQSEAAWKTASQAFRDNSTRQAFSKFADEVHEMTAEKNRHLVDDGQRLVRSASGESVNVQQFAYEYRNGKQRRVYKCTLSVHDSPLVDNGTDEDDQEFEVVGSRCKRAYIHYRKGWGGEIPDKFADHADSLENLVGDGWPQYDMPEHDEQASVSVAERFKDHLARGRAQKAHKMFISEAQEKLERSELAKIGKRLRRLGLRSAKVRFKEWKTTSTQQTWLNDGVALEQYTVEVVLRRRGRKKGALVLGFLRPYDYSKPKGKRAGQFRINKMSFDKPQ